MNNSVNQVRQLRVENIFEALVTCSSCDKHATRIAANRFSSARLSDKKKSFLISLRSFLFEYFFIVSLSFLLIYETIVNTECDNLVSKRSFTSVEFIKK